MKILVDENIPMMTVEQLCQMKHDVIDEMAGTAGRDARRNYEHLAPR